MNYAPLRYFNVKDAQLFYVRWIIELSNAGRTIDANVRAQLALGSWGPTQLSWVPSHAQT